MPKQKPLTSKGFSKYNYQKCTKTNSYCAISDSTAGWAKQLMPDNTRISII